MPRETSTEFFTEKNKQNVSDINLYQLHISDTDILYYAERDENVTFDSITYQASSIHRQDIETKKDGTLGSSSVIVPDVYGTVWAYVLSNKETIRKMTISILTVWENYLDQPDAYIEDDFNVVNATRNYTSVSFSLQNPLVFDDVLPRGFWSKTKCRHTYGDIYCAHSGASCDNTLDNCKKNNNQIRFGGFPLIKRKWF